jgi:hypothetical protein
MKTPCILDTLPTGGGKVQLLFGLFFREMGPLSPSAFA